jgi:hypothetical protein
MICCTPPVRKEIKVIPNYLWLRVKLAIWLLTLLLAITCVWSGHNSWALVLALTFASPCLGHDPEARVTTFSPTRRRGQCPHWHLENYFINAIAFIWIMGHQLPTFATGPCLKLIQASPSFQHFIGKSKGSHKKPLTFISSKDLN